MKNEDLRILELIKQTKMREFMGVKLPSTFENKVKMLSGTVVNMLFSGNEDKKPIINIFKEVIRDSIANFNNNENTTSVITKRTISLNDRNIASYFENVINEKQINPGNVGMLTEFLIKELLNEKSAILKLSWEDQIAYFLNSEEKSVPLSMAMAVNKDKTLNDIYAFFTDKKLIAAIITNMKLYSQILGNNKCCTKGPQQNDEHRLITCYEVDFINDSDYIIDFKCSLKHTYLSNWLYQLILYYFIFLKHGKKYKGIMCFNPILCTYWKIDMDKFFDINKFYDFLADNFII